MGISISWLAVRGAERDVVLEALALAETGERDEFPAESPIQGAALNHGWYVVVFDQYGHALLNDETLRMVSEVGEVVAGMAEEHVMCSYSGAWQRGQRVWCAMHVAQEGIRHLDVEGQMPRGFDQIRDHLLSQQDAEDGAEAEVDYVYDIPLDTARLVSGFSWSETEPEGWFRGPTPHRLTMNRPRDESPPLHGTTYPFLKMTLVSAERRLIVAYAALLALFDLSVLLPGNPVSNTGEFIVAVGVQALVVWRLWEGSSLSWLLAMFFAAGYIVTIVLMQPKVEVGVILTFVLSVAQVLTLWMYVLTQRRPLSGAVGIPPSPLGRQ